MTSGARAKHALASGRVAFAKSYRGTEQELQKRHDSNRVDRFHIDNNHTPSATRPTPTRRAGRQPKGMIFFKRMSNARAMIQSTFITPPANRSVVSIQQQPTQYAPWRRPSISEPGVSRRKPPWRIRNANGL